MIDVDIQMSLSDGRRRFDLDVRFACDARMVALYGPSGAGKSLTLQAIAGLQRPASGHVRIGARTLFDAARGIELPVQDRRVGYLFQHYALFPHLDVRENVAFGLQSWCRRRLPPQAIERIDALLDSFGLAAFSHSRPAALSGGQQQRVALARTLACEPAVLLLDEPFAALNPMLRQALRIELAEVCARWQTPVVMITHDIDDVIALSDVAYVIEHGQVVREVDVRQGTGRERMQRALVPEWRAPSQTPAQGAARALLAEVSHG